jgi:hypothetical protein
MLVALAVAPIAIYGVMRWIMGIDHHLSMVAFKDFPVFWLNILVATALYYSNISSRIIWLAVFSSIVGGSAWILLGLKSEVLQISLVIGLFALLFLIIFINKSAFRVAVFALVSGLLAVSLIHHIFFIYDVHKVTTPVIQKELESSVSIDQPDWGNGPCIFDGWHLDQCLRFSDQFISGFSTNDFLNQSINYIKSEYQVKNDRIVGGVFIDNDEAPHWALSYDGEFWQIAYWSNSYYEDVILALMVWLWNCAVIIWSGVWLYLINWHSKTKRSERRSEGKKMGYFVSVILAVHFFHLFGLSKIIPVLVSHDAKAHPWLHSVATPHIQDSLMFMAFLSIAGWIFIAGMILLFHIGLIRSRIVRKNHQ